MGRMWLSNKDFKQHTGRNCGVVGCKYKTYGSQIICTKHYKMVPMELRKRYTDAVKMPCTFNKENINLVNELRDEIFNVIFEKEWGRKKIVPVKKDKNKG